MFYRASQSLSVHGLSIPIESFADYNQLSKSLSMLFPLSLDSKIYSRMESFKLQSSSSIMWSNFSFKNCLMWRFKSILSDPQYLDLYDSCVLSLVYFKASSTDGKYYSFPTTPIFVCQHYCYLWPNATGGLLLLALF